MTCAHAVMLLLVPGLALAAPNKVAVIVGANQGLTNAARLRYAHRDAEAMAAALIDVSGFAPSAVTVLKDPEPDELLRVIAEQQRTLAGSDTVSLFYFSGHADGQALYTHGNALSLRALQLAFDASPAHLKLGILDACDGGGWTRAKGLVPAGPEIVPVTKVFSTEGSALVSSSSGMEQAHESDALAGSFFTHHFIAALRGAAEQTLAGEVTLQAAFRYAKERTIRDSALFASQPQHPSFSLNLRGRDDVVLSHIDTSPSALEVEQHDGPLTLIHLPSGQAVLELPAGKRSVRLAVAPGTYLVRRGDANGVYAREVTVPSGSSVEVDEASLVLVGSPLLAVKAPGSPMRRFELGINPLMPVTSFLAAGVGVTAQYRFERWFVLRARATYTGDPTGSLANNAASIRRWASDPIYDAAIGSWASISTRSYDAVLGVDVGFIPLVTEFGAERRLEMQLNLGTSLALTNEYTVTGGGPLNPVVFSSGPVGVIAAPVSMSAAFRFYFLSWLAVHIEAEATWYLPPQSSLEIRGYLKAGLTFAL